MSDFDIDQINMVDPFKILTREARANPQAIYARMRDQDPVHCAMGPVTGNNFWFITRYDDCVAALKNQMFGKEFRKRLPADMVAKFGPEEPAFVMMNQNMLFVDPPDHTRLRSLVHKAFTPRMIDNLRPRIQTIADDLLDKMGSSGETDLLDSFAFPLPITVIAELLGIPASDQNQFREWTRGMMFSADMEEINLAALSFVMYMHQMFDDRRLHPQEDLISGLVAVEEAGDKLSTEELISMVFLLLVAGHETTVNLIGNGTLALLQHRDQLAKLRQEPTLIKNAVEEMLRYNGPIEAATTRWAFDNVRVGDKTIPLGDQVFVALASANRDPAVFADPDKFDITRAEASKHIGFGNGLHYCLGAPLARMEGTIAINALVQRLPHLDLAVPTTDLKWSESILLHGMAQMPVRY
ncbi:MAG: cytochrome P450 [Anaerolineae bacterium]|nr:cytochrome P450 [Anaerolineae bacterium]